jgi:hypothetical protein
MKKLVKNENTCQRLVSKNTNNSKFLKLHLKQNKGKSTKTQDEKSQVSCDKLPQIKIDECDLIT